VTDSVRKQIVDAAIALINTSPPYVAPLADDTRQQSYTPDELPSIAVFEIREDGQSEKEGRWSYFVKRAFTLRIEIRIAADRPRPIVDPMYVWIGQKLADQPYTLLQIDFRVEYSTLKNDPTKTQ
jgi:hypothetical protein